MDIKKATNAIKIGHFIIKNGHRNKIDIAYEGNIDNSILKADTPRVYLFTQDSIIKKIGGSASRGGIKATMNFYTSAMTGSPGVPRFVVHLLLREALDSGSNVDLYMITSSTVEAKISGLFETKIVQIASFKEMEDLCRHNYFKTENRYPDWNFQENHEGYPVEFAKLHNTYQKNRLLGS